jgi:hypothetical protein
MMSRRRPRRRVRVWALAIGAGVVAACVGLPAGAVDPPPGSRNFTAPRSVPNYFSNESGSFNGGAGARPAAPAGTVYAAPGAPAGGYAAAPRRYAGYQAGRAVARGRYRVARGRSGGRRYAVHAARGRSVHSRPVAVRSRAAPVRGRPSVAHGSRVARAGR